MTTYYNKNVKPKEKHLRYMPNYIYVFFITNFNHMVYFPGA